MDEARGCVADDHHDGGWDGDLLRGGTAWQVRLFRWVWWWVERTFVETQKATKKTHKKK